MKPRESSVDSLRMQNSKLSAAAILTASRKSFPRRSPGTKSKQRQSGNRREGWQKYERDVGLPMTERPIAPKDARSASINRACGVRVLRSLRDGTPRASYARLGSHKGRGSSQFVLMRKRSVLAPMKETTSPCRVHVVASESVATSSSSSWARSEGQARSSRRPTTKITVLPATENWPLPPLHQSSRTTSPFSPISRSGIRFDPGWRAASSVISRPKGKPLSARDAPIFETDASIIDANKAARDANPGETIPPLSQKLVAPFYSTHLTLNSFVQRKCRKNPRWARPAGIFCSSGFAAYFRTIKVNG